MRRSHAPRFSNFAIGAAVLALIAVGSYLGFRKEIPFRHHYTLDAVFATSNDLRLNSPVRIAGVNIGKVTKIRHIEGEQAAVVTMRIDKRGLPIHKDAKAKVRPRIFLEGNFFVDINPGSPSAPTLDDGDTIPINQTSAPVQLDQVLTSLQADTRKQLQGLLAELSTAYSGGGARGYQRSQRYWKPAYRDGAIVADATRGQAEHDLSGYVANAGAVAQALDRNGADLQNLVTDFNTTAAAFAARSTRLEQAIAELPRTLHAGMPALASLNRAFPPLRRLIKDLRPAVRSSTPALQANLPLVRQLRGLLSTPELRGLVSDLRPTVPQLAKLNARSIPLMQQTRLASSCQNTVILPWSKDTIQDPTFPATGPVYQDSLKALPGLAGESRTGDANGQWFRVHLSGGAYAAPNGYGGFMLSDNPLEGVNPPVGARSPLRSDVPCETQQPPDLRTNPGVVNSRRATIPASKQATFQKILDQEVAYARKVIKASPVAQRLHLRVSAKPVTTNDIQALRALRNRLERKAG